MNRSRCFGVFKSQSNKNDQKTTFTYYYSCRSVASDLKKNLMNNREIQCLPKCKKNHTAIYIYDAKKIELVLKMINLIVYLHLNSVKIKNAIKDF